MSVSTAASFFLHSFQFYLPDGKSRKQTTSRPSLFLHRSLQLGPTHQLLLLSNKPIELIGLINRPIQVTNQGTHPLIIDVINALLN